MKISAKAGPHLFEIVVERQDDLYLVDVDGQRHVVDARKLEGDFYTILTGGRSYEVSIEADGDGYWVRHGAAEQRVTISDPSRRAREGRQAADGPQKIVAAMPGRVVRLLVAEGDAFQAGQGLVVVEAMKMENELTADRDGKVVSIAVETGQSVEGGALLMVID